MKKLEMSLAEEVRISDDALKKAGDLCMAPGETLTDVVESLICDEFERLVLAPTRSNDRGDA